jgi:chromosome segregation ATPase
MRRGIAVLAVIVAGIGAVATWREGAAAQVRQPAPDPEVLPALLIEVRGLRTAIEQMVSAGPRVQLTLGRLQLQEQRVDTVVRRLETVRGKLVEKQDNYNQVQQALTEMDDAVSQPPQPGQAPAAELKQMQIHLRREVAQLAGDVQRLTAEESSVAAELATEQGRWTDLNQRMEELERTLDRR